MFVADLMAGEGADIIPMDGLNYQQLAAKGLLEDLYPYIDEDPEMDREDFFPNLLDALTVDGGLYQAVSGFSVQTLAGAASIVGNTPGWTYEDYYAALAAMPEGCTPLDIWSTKDVVLNSMLYVVLNDLVDWSTGEVRFDSPEFRQMLEFVNSFPESYDWENYDMMETAEQRVRQGRQMLMQVGLYSPESLLWSDMDLSGRATFVGWPTSEGVGSAMSLTTGYAISRTCENKDAAWEFLRDQLTEQGQDNTWLIPTNRNVFDRKLAELMEVQYLQDADGNDLQDDNGEKILQPRGSWYDGSNEEHVVYSLTQEQADEILEMIETCTRVTNYDMGLINIVCETAQDYFEGRSSLDDVCSRIQDAVSLYIGK